jgi:hypothetical protein
MGASQEKIGDWTTEQLVHFIENTLRDSPPSKIPNLISENLTVPTKLIVSDQVQFGKSQTTVGAAGTASALPATPSGYFRFIDYTGTMRAVPFYLVN